MKRDNCQRTGNISSKNDVPLTSILKVELFDIWGIDFMGQFPPSSDQNYILVVVDYISKWVEAISCAKSDAVTVLKFLQKNTFTRFGMLRALISDKGTHFVNRIISKLLIKYNVHYRVATAYHHQINRQPEISNLKIKSILQKVVNTSRKD